MAAFTRATGAFTRAKHAVASVHREPLHKTTPEGPSLTAVVRMPAARSSSTSCRAAKVCLAALHAMRPTAAGHRGVSPNASGTKTSGKAQAALLRESRQGRALKRAGGTE